MTQIEETSDAPPPATEDDAGAGAAKRAQILTGARSVFLARGFAAASMGEIAKAAGVSKGTLYVYFDSKTALFQALMEEQQRNTAERLAAFSPENHDVASVLADFGIRLLTALTAPEHISLIRTVTGAVDEFPDIGRSFFSAGPGFGAKRLTEYLRAQADEGHLDLEDPEMAAWHFLGALGQRTLSEAVFAVSTPSAETISSRAEAAARVFMAAYGAKAG